MTSAPSSFTNTANDVDFLLDWLFRLMLAQDREQCLGERKPLNIHIGVPKVVSVVLGDL